MNGYICLYQGKRLEIYADTTYHAQCEVARQLKVPAKKQYQISVHLAEKDAEPGKPGTPVVHVADF